MKYIIKNNEPQEFIDWKKLENDNWKPKYKNLQNPEKIILFNSLIAEQGGICCYCESELMENNYHIEHIIPQNDATGDSSLDLTYTNMLCSCQRNNISKMPIHCGSAKGDWYDEQLFISPLEPDCEKYFTFTFDGFIKGTCSRGYNTIEILNLNEPNLVKSRKVLIDTFIDMLGDSAFTEEDLSKYVKNHLSQDKNGNFNEFWTTINYLFGSFMTYTN